ncbi:MAG TPA: M1 family aminopeptidase [Ignavibacteriaceae bacterium]
MKLFYKTVLTFLVLLFSINNSSFAQNSVDENPADFYRMESANWIEKKIFEENFLIDTTTDAKFYYITLEVSIDSSFINGNVFFVIESKINNLAQITLDLTDSLVVNNISGSVVSFNRSHDKITLQLDRNYNQGESVSFTVYYSGVPPILNNTKGMRYETHGNSEPIIATLSTPYLAHLWYPCKDGPGDKVDSVYMDIIIPDTTINGNKLIAVSNGSLENVISENGKSIFKWRERYPIVPYYVMIAVSNYSQFQQTIHDSLGNYPIIYNVFKSDSNISVQGTLQIPDAINFFSNKFGPYPFRNEKYGMTQLGFYGAIENQTNTVQNTLNAGWIMVSVHELSHMWFGDMITCSDWHHGWLNEGFATYSEALYQEHLYGFNSYKTYLRNYKYFQGGTLYLQNIDDPFSVFIDIIYLKGAWVLHMLRGVLGDDVFFNCLKQYAKDPGFTYKHASTKDFKMICENVSGQDLDYFFNQWIYDEYYPIYNCIYHYDAGLNLLYISLSQSQAQNGWRSVFKMPVKLKVKFTSGSDTLITVWNDQQNQDYQISLSRQVQSITIDPDEWILRTIGTVTSITDETSSQILSYKLFDNYPNPFNPTTKISWQSPAGSWQTLKIYDLLGNEVAVLVNEYRPAGTYNFDFNSSGLSSGLYIYKLTAGSFTQSKKMLLLK